MLKKNKVGMAKESLHKATLNGDLEQVRYWVNRVDHNGNYNNTLQSAARDGHEAILHLLLPLISTSNGSSVLAAAAYGGHEGVVRLLLPFVDPKTDKSWALRNAAWGGHETLVKLLLPLSNPLDASSEALYMAVRSKNTAVVAVLAPCSNVEIVQKRLMDEEAWFGLETLSPHLSLAELLNVLEKAPQGALPQAHSRVLDLTLAKSLSKIPSSTSPKARM